VENNNGFGLTDYVDFTNCAGIPDQVSISDGSWAYICTQTGTSISYTYSNGPVNNGPC
jgi:hypothetical protein